MTTPQQPQTPPQPAPPAQPPVPPTQPAPAAQPPAQPGQPAQPPAAVATAPGPAPAPVQAPVPGQAPLPGQAPVPGQAPGAPGPYAAQAVQPAPAGSYTSPIPIKRTHLGHAIVSEWTKIISVRSTVWTLSVMFFLVVGIGALSGFGLSTSDYAEAPVLAGGFFGMMLGQLAVITLGVLVITSEYSTGMIRSTMTACPARTRVLTAKALIFFLLSFGTTLVACALTALIQAALVEGKPIGEFTNPDMFNEESVEKGEAIATGGEWLSATVGASLYVALLGVLALSVGALLRSTPGTITTMLGVVLLPFIISLFLFQESTREFGEKLREYSTLNGLSSLYRIPMQGELDGSGWPLLGLLAAVTVSALIGAYARVAVRDV